MILIVVKAAAGSAGLAGIRLAEMDGVSAGTAAYPFLRISAILPA